MADFGNEGLPSNEEQLAEIISQLRAQLFEGPLPDELAEQLPDADPLFLYQLAEREVEVTSENCPAGHIHRDIKLTETFRTAAGGIEPALSLDDALEQVQQKAAELPQGAEQLFQREVGAYFDFDKESGDITRGLVIADAFDTAASLAAGPQAGMGGFLLDPSQGPEKLAEQIGQAFGLPPEEVEKLKEELKRQFEDLDGDDPGFPFGGGGGFPPFGGPPKNDIN